MAEEELEIRHLMSSTERALECAKAAIDKKAENVRILELIEISGFTDYFVIASGHSDTQVRAIASGVEEVLGAHGIDAISIEGQSEGRWVVMDFGDVVVHVFQDALRDYYDLEALWADAPQVRVPSEFYGSSVSRLN